MKQEDDVEMTGTGEGRAAPGDELEEALRALDKPGARVAALFPGWASADEGARRLHAAFAARGGRGSYDATRARLRTWDGSELRVLRCGQALAEQLQGVTFDRLWVFGSCDQESVRLARGATRVAHGEP